MNYTSKQDVLDEYDLFIKVLKRSKSDLQEIRGNDDDVNKIKNAVVKTVEREINSALDFADKSLHNQNWDNLTIGFFGITNAGKSTIVETFRILYDNNRVKNNDGMIVGDGSPDFTTKYDEYKFFIDGTEFTLIDVPGIEGDEKKVKDNIFKGLSKAHIIFYVHGQDSPPDAKIVQKIKNYIGKGVNVYSVFNIRGEADAYDEIEDRVTLLDERKHKAASLVEETFKNALGDIYKGNICVQALLAMTAYATFNAEKRGKLIKTQNKLLSHFGSAKNVLNFSHFQDVVDVVKAKAKNAKSEIIESNAKKLHQQIRQAYSSLSNVPVGSDEKFKTYKQNINTVFSGTLNKIKNRGEIAIGAYFDWFEKMVCERIADDDKEFDDLQKNLEYFINNALREIIDAEYNYLKNKVEKENNKIANLFFSAGNFNASVGSANVSDTDYDFGDFAIDAFSIAGYVSLGTALGTIIPGLGNLIGGILGGITGLLITIFGGKQARITKAQNAAREKINEAKIKTIYSFKEKSIPKIKKELFTLRDDLVSNVNIAINGLKGIKTTIDSAKTRLTNIVA